MKLYLSRGRHWTGTQADAKEAQGGKDYEHIEVPTDKPGLIAWLNEQWAKFPPLNLGIGPAPDESSVMEYPSMTATFTPELGAPYQNGDPTVPVMKSRDPMARFCCRNCGTVNAPEPDR